MSIPWLWYCTIVLQDVIIRRNNQGNTVSLFPTTACELSQNKFNFKKSSETHTMVVPFLPIGACLPFLNGEMERIPSLFLNLAGLSNL